MQALISYNQKTTWDELLSAMDAAQPYIIEMNDAGKVKLEGVEANIMNAYSDDRRCHICKEIGHLKRNCQK